MNINDVDANGVSVFKEIYLNSELSKSNLIAGIFERGYQLTAADIDFYNSGQVNAANKVAQLALFQLYQRLRNRELVNLINLHVNIFYALESARLKKITGFRFPNWISFANNAISAYKDHWKYLEAGFRQYGVWELIKKEDQKGTFEKKLIMYYDELPEQDSSVEPAIHDLFPEITFISKPYRQAVKMTGE